MEDLKEIARNLGVHTPIRYDDLVEGRAVAHTKIALVTELLADALESLAIGQRDYRQWRAKQTIAILEDEPKLAQWKVEARINSLDTFKTIKTELAYRELRVATFRGFVDALSQKASMIHALTLASS